jgi:hypothetical protein
MTFPRTDQPEYTPAQASPWLPINRAGRVFDAFCFYTSVLDRNLATPPGSCADGARYLVATSPTAEWTGRANHVAIAVGTNASNGWYFVDARIAGTLIYLVDEAITVRWNGSAFIDAGTSGQAFAHQVAASDQTTALAPGVAIEFEWPFDATLSAIHGFLRTAAGSGSAVEINVRRNSTSVFTGDLLTIDPAERTSRTALIPANLTTTSFSKGDIIGIDIVDPGDAAAGLILTFEGVKV